MATRISDEAVELARSTSAMYAAGAYNVALVGSAYILGAGEDIDLLVLVENVGEFRGKLIVTGWQADGAASGASEGWASLRRGNFNAILTDDPTWFANFVKAAEVCKALNLKDKTDRIKVHRIVRDGLTPSEA